MAHCYIARGTTARRTTSSPLLWRRGGFPIKAKRVRPRLRKLLHVSLADIDLRAEIREGVRPPQSGDVDHLLLGDPTPISVESFGGLEGYCIGDSLKVSDYYQQAEPRRAHSRLDLRHFVVIGGLQRQLSVVDIPLRGNGRHPYLLLTTRRWRRRSAPSASRGNTRAMSSKSNSSSWRGCSTSSTLTAPSRR